MTSVMLVALVAVCYPHDATSSTDPATDNSTLADGDFIVSSVADSGAGSLRQTILDAMAYGGGARITFDPQVFAEPQTITLESGLPTIETEMTIDGFIPKRLWKATGVIISGDGRFPVFSISKTGRASLLNLTVADGCGIDGGGVLNRGVLVVKGVTFTGNGAINGGGLASLGATTSVINCTFTDNSADEAGGGLVAEGSVTTVTNCTFSDNQAKIGGGLYSSGLMTLQNTILANSHSGMDCVVTGYFSPASTRNLIMDHDGCGVPITSANPRLGPFGYFNGPTKTFPLGGGSPAINLGDNLSAVDENGEALRWDQRGNGDPRFVAGFTDIGAFEHQAFPKLIVDTTEDTDLRACTPSGSEDCPLRGAIELANATGKPQVIRFDSRVFSDPRVLKMSRPLPEITSDVTLDATGTAGVTLSSDDNKTILRSAFGVEVRLIQVVVEGDDQDQEPHPRLE